MAQADNEPTSKTDVDFSLSEEENVPNYALADDEEDENIQKAIESVKKSDLDQTIKDILIRDIQREGLTPFIVEQIKSYIN